MPIEDVDFLHKNSQKQTYVFLIDSKERDRVAYPTPSEYVFKFSPPFANVVGLTVLDASVPRATYNVDEHNNIIYFFVHHPDFVLENLTEDHFAKAVIEPGDYTLQTLLVAVNAVLKMKLNGDANGVDAYIEMQPLSNPPDVKNVVRFWSAFPFIIDMNRSTMSETLGFDLYTDRAEHLVPIDKRRYQYLVLSPDYEPIAQRMRQGAQINAELLSPTLSTLTPLQVDAALLQLAKLEPIIKNHKFYLSVNGNLLSNDPVDHLLGQKRTVFDGPRGVILKTDVANRRAVAQKFRCAQPGYLSGVYVAAGVEQQKSGVEVLWEVRKNKVVANGLAGVTNVPDTSSTGFVASGIIPITYVDGALNDTTKIEDQNGASPAFPFLQNAVDYWLIVNDDNNEGVFAYYNDVTDTDANNRPFLSSDNFSYDANDNLVDVTWTNLSTPRVNYQLCARIETQEPYHSLIAPGIYNLSGERYVILRCPEIEENSYRSLAYTKFNMGIAKFRLGVVGYSEGRNDYNVPVREFHPIGKLSRLSFRFERADGQLYDFKGVNHMITFAITYYEPKQTKTFTRSILNPNYTGDPLQYYYNQQDQEEDSDDQDVDYDKDQLVNYRSQERRYLPEEQARRDREAFIHLNLSDDDDYDEDDEEE